MKKILFLLPIFIFFMACSEKSSQQPQGNGGGGNGGAEGGPVVPPPADGGGDLLPPGPTGGGDVAILPPGPIVVIEEDCEDNLDNNADGATDCADVRCAQKEVCQAPAGGGGGGGGAGGINQLSGTVTMGGLPTGMGGLSGQLGNLAQQFSVRIGGGGGGALPPGVIVPPIPPMGGAGGGAGGGGVEPPVATTASSNCPEDGILDVKTDIEVMRGNVSNLVAHNEHAVIEGSLVLEIKLIPWVAGIKAPRDRRYNYSWRWLTDEGRDSGDAADGIISPSFTFRNAGTKHVKLVVEDTECQHNGSNIVGKGLVDIIVNHPPITANPSQIIVVGPAGENCEQPVQSVEISPVLISGQARVSPQLVEGLHAPYQIRFEAKVNGALSTHPGYTYNWMVDDAPMLNAVAGNRNNISNTFNDLGFHQVNVTVTDNCGNSAYDPIRIVPGEAPPPAAQAACTDCKPEWEKFDIGSGIHQLTVASGDNIAVMVAVTPLRKNVFYLLFDLQNRRFVSDWKPFEKLSQVTCDANTPVQFDKPSVAVTKNGNKFIVTMEKECGNDRNNVFYEKFTKQADGTYREGDPDYMGQRGNKWTPVAMVNDNNDFAISWLFEEINEPKLLQNTRFNYKVQKAYFKILKSNGGQIGPSRFVTTWWQGGWHEPDFENRNVVNEELERRLKGTASGNSFCASFRRILKNNYGTSVLSDKSELVCVNANGDLNMRDTNSFRLDTPALASAKFAAGNMLVAVGIQSDGRLKFDTWLGNEKKAYYTVSQNWPDTVGNITALNSYGLLQVILSNPSGNTVMVFHPGAVGSDNANTMIPGHAFSVPGANLSNTVYSADQNRHAISVWVQNNVAWGITGSVEP